MRITDLSSLNHDGREVVANLFEGLLVVRSFWDFVRILHPPYQDDPFGLSSGPSRFGPITGSRKVVAEMSSFRVIYMAADLATATYETVIRDHYDLKPTRVLSPQDYGERIVVNISTSLDATVSLLDLTDGNAYRHGVPRDITRYATHTDGQHFATFVHTYMPTVDGFLYRSRFTSKHNVAVFDRAIDRLAYGARLPLTRELLSPVLRTWNFSVT